MADSQTSLHCFLAKLIRQIFSEFKKPVASMSEFWVILITAYQTNIARMALTNQLFQVEVAKSSASGRNLFLNSLFKRDLRDKYSTYKLFDDVLQTKGQLAVSIDPDNQFRGVNTLKIVSTFNGKIDNQKITFAIGGNGRTGRDDEFKNKSVRFSFWAKSTVNNTNFKAELLRH